MITGTDDRNLAKSLIEMGVYDYITKPITSNRVLISVANALNRRSLEISNRCYRDGLEKKVEARTKSIKKSMERIRENHQWGHPHHRTDSGGPGTPIPPGHQRGVAELARAMAVEMRLSDELVEGVYLAGLIHDLGKISIPAEILSKPGELSDIQFNLIKETSSNRIRYSAGY